MNQWIIKKDELARRHVPQRVPLAYQYTSAQPYHHGQTGTTGYYMWSGAAEPPTTATAQTLNDTGDSGNSSTMSSGSPPPQEALTAVEAHHVTSLHPHNTHSHAHSHGHTPIKVEDAYGGTVPAYPAMQNHHFHYQQQIQVRSGREDPLIKSQKHR